MPGLQKKVEHSKLSFQKMLLLPILLFQQCLFWYRKWTSKTFPRFHSLPPELRQMVYSKMSMEEGLQMVKASSEAEEFFSEKGNRIPCCDLFMYVSEERGRAAITMLYGTQFMEQFILPPEMAATLSTELDSYRDCSCSWCEDWENFTIARVTGADESKDVREYEIPTRVYEFKSMNQVMHTLKFLRPRMIHIRTYPYGGFLETVSPSFPLSPGEGLAVYWHVRTEEEARPLNIEMWNKWIGYNKVEGTLTPFSSLSVSFSIFTSDSFAHCVSTDVFSLNAVEHAGSLQIDGIITATISQLSSLRAWRIVIRSAVVSPSDALLFYKAKIEVWIRDPLSLMYYCFPGLEFAPRELLEDVLDDLLGVRPDIVFYRNYIHMIWGHTEYDGSDETQSMTLRSLKGKSVLFVNREYLPSSGFLYFANNEEPPFPNSSPLLSIM